MLQSSTYINEELLKLNLKEYVFDDEKSSIEVEYVVIHDVRVTAYAPFDNKSGLCNDGDPASTSTGTYPSYGTIAVDPSKIPYGTEIYVDGYGFGIALDTGGALRNYDGHAIDLYFDTYEEAMDWGVRYIDVLLYND